MTTYFPLGLAIVLTLLAASMWGSWMQIVKHTGKYPIEGIAFFLYVLSFVLVWAVTLILKPFLLTESIWYHVSSDWAVSFKILVGGAMMSMGLLFSLTAMSRVGLLLSTALSGAVGTILGLIISIIEEGMPKTDNALLLLILCTATMIAASFVCNYASILRDRDRAGETGIKKEKQEKTVTFKVILMIALAAILTTGWSVGTAAGTASGFPPIITCALMATGSFIGMTVVGSIMFTIKKEWKEILCIGKPKKPIALSVIAALCHYGGNIISIYSMPGISATLSFLFGRTSAVWTYFWGIYYKEFAGVRKRTTTVLILGIALYFLGLVFLGFFNYS